MDANKCNYSELMKQKARSIVLVPWASCYENHSLFSNQQLDIIQFKKNSTHKLYINKCFFLLIFQISSQKKNNRDENKVNLFSDEICS